MDKLTYVVMTLLSLAFPYILLAAIITSFGYSVFAVWRGYKSEPLLSKHEIERAIRPARIASKNVSMKIRHRRDS